MEALTTHCNSSAMGKGAGLQNYRLDPVYKRNYQQEQSASSRMRTWLLLGLRIAMSRLQRSPALLLNLYQ
jgi:hypothetical protein